MIEDYEKGDPYLAYAIVAGYAPVGATREMFDKHPEYAAAREWFKPLSLATLYGMGPRSMAERMGKPLPFGVAVLDAHQRRYRAYWEWTDKTKTAAILNGHMTTCLGWQMKVTSNNGFLNTRTLANFPIQATGAEILRVACIRLYEEGFQILAPVHDAILVECREEEIEPATKRVQEIMSDASELVLGPGCLIGTDVKIIRHPENYFDKKGQETWNSILKILREIENGE